MVTQVDQSPENNWPVTNYCVVGNMSDLKMWNGLLKYLLGHIYPVQKLQ